MSRAQILPNLAYLSLASLRLNKAELFHFEFTSGLQFLAPVNYRCKLQLVHDISYIGLEAECPSLPSATAMWSSRRSHTLLNCNTWAV